MYIKGETIKELRKLNEMTQLELANKLNVSDKTISKWETNSGLPDITIIDSLAATLNVSITELISGEHIINDNKCGNMLNSKFYVCPICGNVIHTIGDTVISCCGINLPSLESEKVVEFHNINIDKIEDEYYICVDHSMTKEHYISFISYVTNNSFELIKLYPESNAEARFKIKGHGNIYIYCNRDGLYKKTI